MTTQHDILSVLEKCKVTVPEKDISTDEQVIPMKCHAPIKHSMPMKPNKWGGKITWACCRNNDIE